MCNTGNKIMICQLQNEKSDTFTNMIFTYTFSRNHYFNSSFKSCVQEAFLVKVILKNTLHSCISLYSSNN